MFLFAMLCPVEGRAGFVYIVILLRVSYVDASLDMRISNQRGSGVL